MYEDCPLLATNVAQHEASDKKMRELFDSHCITIAIYEKRIVYMIVNEAQPNVNGGVQYVICVCRGF